MSLSPVLSKFIFFFLVFASLNGFTQTFNYQRTVGKPPEGGELRNPMGIATAKDGTIYVSDAYNGQIQVFNNSGTFTRRIGKGGYHEDNIVFPWGIALDENENVYAIDYFYQRVVVYTKEGEFLRSFGSIGTNDGQFKDANALAVDKSGNIYVCDAGNDRIQVFNSTGQFVTKFGTHGSGEGQFNFPTGISLDNEGKIYVADEFNYSIQVFNNDRTFNRKFLLDPTGISKEAAPVSITLDGNKNIYTIDRENQIRVFTNSGTLLHSFKVNFESKDYLIIFKYLALTNDGNILVTDLASNQIHEFTTNGTLIRKIGLAPNADGKFFFPSGIFVNEQGDIYIADQYNNRIQAFSSDGNFLSKFGIYGETDETFDSPTDLAVAPDGTVYIADEYKVKIFDSSGNYKFSFPSGSEWNRPSGICIDADKNIYIISDSNNKVTVYSQDGSLLRSFGSKGTTNGHFNNPLGIALDKTGKIYISDTENHRIQVFSNTGTFIKSFGTFGSGNGQFNSPSTIDVDDVGDIYITDTYNHRVQIFTTSGQFKQTFGTFGSGNGQFVFPYGITVDKNKNVFVSDIIGNRVQVFSTEVSTKETPVITFSAITKTYGDAAFTLAATSTSNAPVTYSIVADPANTGKVILTGSKSENVQLITAGTVKIRASVAENAMYKQAEKEIILTIKKAPLTIVVDNKSKYYGSTNPLFTHTITGFKNSETESVINSKPSLSTTATITSSAGEYPIVAADALDDNYDFVIQQGVLTIFKKPLTVSVANASRVYGTSNPAFQISYDGFVNDENETVLDTAPTINTVASTTSSVGKYPLKPENGIDNNYEFIYSNGELTITKAPQTIEFPPIDNVLNSQSTLSLHGVASSKLPVIYTIKEGFTILRQELGGVFTLTKEIGKVTIQCSQLGNVNFFPAIPVTRSFQITSDVVLALPEQSMNEFSTFPNPANEILYLYFPAHMNVKMVQLTDTKGSNLLEAASSDKSNFSINTHDFPNGIYTLRITTLTEVLTQKIVVEH